MKSISVRELQRRLKEFVDASQGERVVVTRHGKPAAILVGVEGQDWEELVLETDPKFWRMLAKRRQEPTMSAEEMRGRVLGEERPK